jgi:outer membrane protein TolC
VETIALHKAFEKDLTLPKNITSTLLTQRPDLLSALWTTKKNALNVGVAVTNFLPVVTLMDAPLFLSAQGQKLFNPDSFANLLLPEVSQPLFTGGRLLSAWRKNVATYESSVYEFNDLFLKAAKEVFDSVINFIKISEMETLQEEKVKLTKDNYDLEFLKFSHGISSMLPVLDYDETYLENKTLMIEKQRLKKLAYISFIKALGGGYKEKEGAIEELEK